MSVVLQIKNLKVRSLDVDFNEVTWELCDSKEDLLDYTFQVLRSESAMGPFQFLTPELEDQFIFVDNNIPIGNIYRQLHYKIRIKHKESGKTEDFGPVSMQPEADLIALELRKHMNLLMREFIGRRCWVLPARTFGMRCGCWDPILSKRTRSGCRTCFDTGFVRGYMSPIETWVSIDPSPKAEQQTNVGVVQQDNTTARLTFFPELKPGDLIVEPENKRWRVTKITPTEQVRAEVHQEVELHAIPKTDIEFLIPIRHEGALKDLFLSPARNATNPQTLENFEREEIPGIFNLYPTSYPTVKT